MAEEKIYAVVFPNGRHEIMTATWEKVRVIVDGVSGIKFKSFPTPASAEEWVEKTKAESKKEATRNKAIKEIKKKNQVSNTEWMSKNVNTPFWNKIKNLGKRVSEE
jgi:viroplasmin and RNaseH domain-containing protein